MKLDLDFKCMNLVWKNHVFYLPFNPIKQILCWLKVSENFICTKSIALH